MSEQFKLTKTDTKRWYHNLLVFLAPVAVIYLTTTTGLLMQEGHTILLTDFIPNNFTIGAMVLYVLNGLLDIIRKFVTVSR